MPSRPFDADCIFCKIVSGTIPSACVYEDADVYAFLDINPISRGHALVVPRGHYPTLLDLPAGEGEALLSALRRVAGALMAECGCGGFNCISNNFGVAGQVVPHFHWHIVPRVDGDGLSAWPGGKYKDNAGMGQLAKSIKERAAFDCGGSI
ncbi:MAG: HIT family protein [Desulfovibrio sp.]|jgi:histidine triad (HIT) family protein|nr:HIT family protein [Desulfovibrio sp.]